MRKLFVVIAIIIALVSMYSCRSQGHDNSDIVGMWYSASGDDSSVEFYKNGNVKMEGYNAGTGMYSYDSGEMEGEIFMPGFIIPRIYKFYCFLDDTLQISDKEYLRKH